MSCYEYCTKVLILVYCSTPYVRMTPETQNQPQRRLLPVSCALYWKAIYTPDEVWGRDYLKLCLASSLKLTQPHKPHHTSLYCCTSTLYRLKEELIRELVKNSRTMKGLNESYLSKIQKLEKVSSIHARKVAHVYS